MILTKNRASVLYLMMLLLIILLAGAGLAGNGKNTKPAKTGATASAEVEQPPQQSPVGAASAEPDLGEEINWQVIGSGGGFGSSEDYEVNGTSGQPAVGSGSSEDYQVGSGYWQEPVIDSYCDVVGDANSDQNINVGDAVYLINYVFKSGPPPDPLEAGDANCDDAVNVGDAVYVINYVFKSGPAPGESCCP